MKEVLKLDIVICPAAIEQKPVLAQLMELYMYDFSEFSGEDVSECGYYGYKYMDNYWTEAGRMPLLIRVDGKLAGFALVRACSEYSDMPVPHCIGEFFVMKKYRRRGVGRTAACRVFDMFPGNWEVSQWKNNLPAQRFWRRVISEYTGGEFSELCTDDVVVQAFSSAVAGRA